MELLKAMKWSRVGKMARSVAVVAAIVWVCGALFIPNEAQGVIAGWWNGVLLSLVCTGLVLWSGISLFAGGQEGRKDGRSDAGG